MLRYLKKHNIQIKKFPSNLQNYMIKMHSESSSNQVQIIKEGLATVKTKGKVFYNPVQEFNRDLSISVLNTFSAKHNQDGLTILEALSATGLRSIRYAKEVKGIKQIVANDISHQAVEDMKLNIQENHVENLVVPSQSDAVSLMYEHRSKQFDVIDLDPYGCPSRFLDSALQAIKDDGLLLITATDMAVLAGNAPETCYSKYGAISLRIKCCHEMGLRILLQCIESHANRYGRYIEPLVSISADFYIRVFIKVYSGPHKCKFTTSKLSMVYQCTGCDTFRLQPLGILKKADNDKQTKFKLPTGPPVGQTCEHCGHSHHIGGPIWTGPIHNRDFVLETLSAIPEHLGTRNRIQGVLNVILEELIDSPLYFILEKLSATLHIETPPMMTIRSALLNAGYKVSFSHTHKTSIKTNAPAKVLWDIMRCWELKHPLTAKRRAEKSAGNNILAKAPENEYSFAIHPEANPQSRKEGRLRFPENPQPFWGPGTRATAMVSNEKMDKSRRNQGKRKLEQLEECQ